MTASAMHSPPALRGTLPLPPLRVSKASAPPEELETLAAMIASRGEVESALEVEADDTRERFMFELGVTGFGMGSGVVAGGKTGAVVGALTAYGWARRRWELYR